MSKTDNYLENAASDARDTVSYFEDTILEQLVESGKASDDLYNDYPGGDSYHHESHVDKWYSLQDACEVITQLDEFEETDSGLWEGQGMKEALSTCAAYTYGQAVYHEFSELIGRINDEADDIITDFNGEEADLEEVISELDDEISDLNDSADETEDADQADECRAEAEEKARERTEKQAELDSLPERKGDALRTMLGEFASAERT